MAIISSPILKEAGIRVPTDSNIKPTKLSVHFDIEINYVYEGSVRYFLGRTDWTLPERRLVAFWGTTPHRLVEQGPGAKVATLTLPLVDMLRWRSARPMVDAVLDGAVVIEPVELTSPARMERWVLEAQSSDVNLQNAAMLEIQAAMLRSQVMMPAKKSTSNSSTEFDPVVLMCRHIAANLSDSLTSGEVADVAGLHPNYAMRVFKKLTGMTIQDYVVQSRLAVAQRLLIRSGASVEDIGDEAGFQCASQYYATFKKMTGHTPLQFRKRNVY